MTQAEDCGHSVNVSDFGGNKFMRINDLYSDWSLWHGIVQLCLLLTHSGKENRVTVCSALQNYQYYKSLTTLTFT